MTDTVKQTPEKDTNDTARQTLKEELQSQKGEPYNNIIAESQSMRFDIYAATHSGKETNNPPSNSDNKIEPNKKIEDKENKETENRKTGDLKDSTNNKIPLEYKNQGR